MPRTFLPVLISLLLARASFAAEPIRFDVDVRPLFAAHCVKCHGPARQEGGLRFDLRSAALRGGDGGPLFVPGKPAESELLRRVASADETERMPPEGERLSANEIDVLRRWIEMGAEWPESEADRGATRDPRLDHWVWKPIARPSAPAVVGAVGLRNEIDHFIAAKLVEKQLTMSPEADALTLIRRLSFDLIGLPPTPEEAAAFVSHDNGSATLPLSPTLAAKASESAYEALVDRLLASPRYGERWARHWLDVVHYGDTHGYDKDKPRPNAWPYRDYVIRAFNDDKPYARFVQEQVAGDVLFPYTRDGNEALGFIAAGPWDFIGHAEVPETKIDGKIARHLDRDDMVGNTLGTFCSVTVQCAQCHNHKFDPITQEDYYSLQAVYAALDRAERQYFADADAMRCFEKLQQEGHELFTRQAAIEAGLRAKIGAPAEALDRRIAAARKVMPGNSRAEFGYHSAVAVTENATKWVQVDLGRSVVIDRIVLRPCYDDFNDIGAGFGFPRRFRVELSNDPEFRGDRTLVVSREESDLPNPGTAAQTWSANGATARYVRVTAVKLAPRKNDFIFALSELQVFDAVGQNAAESGTVTALDSIEAPPRWRKANLVDKINPPDGTGDELTRLRAERDALFDAASDEAMRRERREIRQARDRVAEELKHLQSPDIVYAGTVHRGTGNFAGTSGKPRPIHILARGSVQQPGREVGPGAIAAIEVLASRFALPTDHTEGERRGALARWLTDPKNPLTWRSIVNRVWQYHFGRGLVETADDFGRMGAAPSHAELLDWLAADFRDSGGSLKRLHKQIVMSATYRQASSSAAGEMRQAALDVDADNRLLWRQNRRKLEAEAIHDAVLAVSGKLDLKMGGPGYQDFVIEHPAHSPHYQYDLADPNDAKTWRRAVYRFVARSQTQPWMSSLDCADPSMRVDKRNESASPLQALALLNDGFMIVQSAHYSERVAREAGDDAERQAMRAMQLAVGRDPTDDERRALSVFIGRYGLASGCRAILNLNEFTFVD